LHATAQNVVFLLVDLTITFSYTSMKNSTRFFLTLIVSISILLCASQAMAQSRLIGAGGLVLDDGNGNTITLLPPSNLDGNYIYMLPQSPGGNIMSGYVGAGSALGQILYWNGTYWQPGGTGTTGQVLTINGSGVPTWATGGGGIAGTGTTRTIPIWSGASSLGNSLVTDDGTTLTYSGKHINIAGDYEIGGSTVLSDAGTQNIFVGVGAGSANGSGFATTAIGYNTNANNAYATALGWDASATSVSATALGAGATASVYATVIGVDANAGASNATALGLVATANFSNGYSPRQWRDRQCSQYHPAWQLQRDLS
jgi:hypothetical protein